MVGQMSSEFMESECFDVRVFFLTEKPVSGIHVWVVPEGHALPSWHVALQAPLESLGGRFGAFLSPLKFCKELPVLGSLIG